MPVHACESDGKPGYAWGNQTCYTYTPGDDAGKREAERKAHVQGYAIEQQGAKAALIIISGERENPYHDEQGRFTSGPGGTQADSERIVIRIGNPVEVNLHGGGAATGGTGAMLTAMGAQDMSAFMPGHSVRVGAGIVMLSKQTDTWLPKGLRGREVLKIDSLNTSDPTKPQDTLAVLRKVTEAADAHNVTLVLDAHPFSTQWVDKREVKLRDLKRLYGRYGFVEPKQSSPNWMGFDSMVREPGASGRKDVDLEDLALVLGMRDNPNHDERGRFASGPGGGASREPGVVREGTYRITSDPLEARWVAPNGALVAPLPGGSIEHFETAIDMLGMTPDEDYSGGIVELEDAGWVRFSAVTSGVSVELRTRPTAAQLRTIRGALGDTELGNLYMDTPTMHGPAERWSDFLRALPGSKEFDDIDLIEIAQRDNPYHDELGRFASGPGGPSLPPAVRAPGEAAVKNVGAWLDKQGWGTPADLEANARQTFAAATPTERETGLRWYEQAHAVAREIADAHNLTIEQAAGVVASLSPNSSWETNQENARTVTALVTAPTFTLDADALRARYDVALKMARELDGPARARAEAKAQAAYSEMKPWTGTHPTGDVPGSVLAHSAHIQQYPDNTEKAIAIIRGQSPRDALWTFEQVGPRNGPKQMVPTDSGLKVRSFFANILQPRTSNEVTVDTHIMRALTGDMTIRPDQSGVVSGNSARYSVFRDPIVKIAREEGMQPHQVQAIIWTVINEATTRRDVGNWALAATKDYTLDDGTVIADIDFLIAKVFAGYTEAEARALLDEQSGTKEDALAFMSGAKFNPNHDEAGRFAPSDVGGATDPVENAYKVAQWFDEKAVAPGYDPNSSVSSFTLASDEARGALKQEIVETVAPYLSAVMPDTLPLRLTATGDGPEAMAAAREYTDSHDSLAMLRQQGVEIDGKLAEQQGPVGDRPFPGPRMTADDIRMFNARVFVDANMDAWHMSSSDSDARSVALQAAAVAEFDLNDADTGWVHPVADPDSQDILGINHAGSFDAAQARLEAHTTPEQFRSYLRATYDHTQAELAKAGIKGEITVYRGMGWNTLDEVPEELRGVMTAANAIDTVAQVKTQSNPLSSWSVSYLVARDFASSGGVYRATLKATIRVSDIIATARTGMGALTEGEIIVKGGALAAEVAKVSS